MLAKLHITPHASAEKIHSTIAIVAKAIDDQIADDAASRTALKKLHLALGKAMGEAGKAKKSANDTLAEDGVTTTEAQEIVLESDQDFKMEIPEVDGVLEAKDSLLEELLDDDENM